MKRAVNIYLLLPLAVAGYGLLALFSPGNFLKAGVLAIAAAIAGLAYLFPATFLGVLILSLQASPEYHLESVLAVNDTRSLHRLAILLALAANGWRYGLVWRSNPPVVALFTMFLITLTTADLLPALSTMQMVKSLIGLSLPFLFLFCAYRHEAVDRYLDLCVYMPLAFLIAGFCLQAAGLHNAYGVEYTGAVRVGGMTIAAYAGFFAYSGFFVSTYQSLTTNRRRYFVFAGINLVIIMVTGTRMPMLTAAVLTVVVVLFAPQRSFSVSERMKVIAAGMVLLAGVLYFVWPQIEQRIFGSNAAGLAGRDYIWAYYMQGIEKNPWFGRGIGAGVVFLDTIDDRKVNFTNAAHNEYLRILMDAGIVGLVIFVAAMFWWVWSEARFMRKEERVLFFGFMLTFAIASFTANTLSSPYTLVMLFPVALMIQRARERATVIVRSPSMAAFTRP